MAWRSVAAHDHSRVLAQCFAGTDHDPVVAEFIGLEVDEIWQAADSWKRYCEELAEGLTAQLEDYIWQKASCWKGYCEGLAKAAAIYGHEGCLRVLHELGGEAAASVAAANEYGYTPAHSAAENGHEGCLRVLHELGSGAAASLAAKNCWWRNASPRRRSAGARGLPARAA